MTVQNAIEIIEGRAALADQLNALREENKVLREALEAVYNDPHITLDSAEKARVALNQTKP